jgi:hypothetical protein
MNQYGAMVEWHWQGKAKVLGEKPVSDMGLNLGLSVVRVVTEP